MAINFETLNGSTSTPTEVTPTTSGVVLNLEKNTILDLSKVAPGLSLVSLGAGWDVANVGSDVDLDISVFLLNANGKITSASDVVFYQNRNALGVSLSEDNRTGMGEGDDETISLNLNQVSPSVQRIVACVTIYDAINRRQTFGVVENSYIRLVNQETNQELAKYNLKGDYSTDTAVVFAELVRSGNDWAFHAIGEGKQGDLNSLAALYS